MDPLSLHRRFSNRKSINKADIRLVRSSTKNSLGPEPSARPKTTPKTTPKITSKITVKANVCQDVDIPSARMSGMSLAWEKIGKKAEAAVLANPNRRSTKRQSKLPILNLTSARNASDSSTGSTTPTPGLTDSSDEDDPTASTSARGTTALPSPPAAGHRRLHHTNASKGPSSPTSKRTSKAQPVTKRSPTKGKPSTPPRKASNAERATILSDITEADNESRISDVGLDGRIPSGNAAPSTSNQAHPALFTTEAFTSPRPAPPRPTPINSRWSSSTESSNEPKTPTLAAVNRLYNSVKDKHRARRATASSKSAPSTPKTPSSVSPVQKAFPEEVKTQTPTLKSKRSLRNILRPSASAPSSRKASVAGIGQEQQPQSAALASKSASSLPVRQSSHMLNSSPISPSKTAKKSLSVLKVCSGGSWRNSTYEMFEQQYSMSAGSQRTATSSSPVSSRTSPNFSRPLRDISYVSATGQSPSQTAVGSNDVRPTYINSNPSAESVESKASAISATLHAVTTSETSLNSVTGSNSSIESDNGRRPSSNRSEGRVSSNSTGSSNKFGSAASSGRDQTLSTSEMLTALPTSQSSPTLLERSSASTGASVPVSTSTRGHSSAASKSCPSLKNDFHPSNPLLQETVKLDAPVVPLPDLAAQIVRPSLPISFLGSQGSTAAGFFTRCGRKCDHAIHTVVGKVKKVDVVVDAIAMKAADWHSQPSTTERNSQKLVDVENELHHGCELKANRYGLSNQTTVVSNPMGDKIREAALVEAERKATWERLEGRNSAVHGLDEDGYAREAEEVITPEAARARALRSLEGENTSDNEAAETKIKDFGAAPAVDASQRNTTGKSTKKNKGKEKALPPLPQSIPRKPSSQTNASNAAQTITTPEKTSERTPSASTSSSSASAVQKPIYLKHKRSYASSFRCSPPSKEALSVSPPVVDDRGTSGAFTMHRNASGQNIDSHGVYTKLRWQEDMRSMGYEPADGSGVGLGITLPASEFK